MPGVSPVNTGDPDLEYAFYLAERRVLEIQAKLHRWARDDPHRRFGDLFNLVADPAFLLVGWARVRGNKGAKTAGVDGRTAVSIEARGVEEFLGALRDCLKDRSFCPLPSRERLIPKPGTAKRRRLGISTIRDRVVQASLKLVLEPIFEADFHPCSYGFRPGRRVHDAVAEVRHLTSHSYEWIVEGDIRACLDPWSYCSFFSLCLLEQAVLRGGDLDTQAFPASGAGQDGPELAVLDFLQYGLAGDAERLAGIAERDPAVGGGVGEHAA
jgi:retron-type reverse transcriptase